MLYLVFLIILTVVLFFWIDAASSASMRKKQGSYARQSAESEKLARQSAALKNENLLLENKANETTALYDITKEICKTLDKEKIFTIFKEASRRSIRVGDCRFLDSVEQLAQFKDYTVLPLNVYQDTLGYLVASDVAASDTEKFYILAQQFLVGVKRAILYNRVQELAISDSLTQVYSRRYFMERFEEEVERSKKFKLKCSFLMADIDHLKECNDRFGHLVGDAMLKETAKMVKENIRQIDFIGRYGGEELCVVLTETDKASAVLAAQRIRQAVASSMIRAYDEELKATISIGVATFPDDANSVSALIDSADKALYRAKQAGRNTVR